MSGVTTAWSRYWFETGSPLRLGVARAVFFAGVLVLYLRYDFAAWGELAPSFWQPVWVLRVFGAPRPSVALLTGMVWIWRVALLSSCVGLFTRAATVVTALLGLYLFGMVESWGRIGHSSAHLALVSIVLAFSHCGDAFSLDAWWRRRRGHAPAEPSGEHTWPIRAAWLFLALMLFAGGVAKLRVSGLAWLEPTTLSEILRARAEDLVQHPSPLSAVGAWLAGQPTLCGVAATATVVTELTYPLVLVSARARAVLVPAAMLLFVGIAAFIVLAFGLTVLLSHLAFYAPWDRLLRLARPGSGRS